MKIPGSTRPPRIHGELLKLGIEIGQTSVAKYMVRRRHPPSQGWRTFIRNHADGIAAMPSAWLRRKVFHPSDGGPLWLAIYLATLVWPISMPSLSNSPWIRGAPHSGLAMLVSRISRRILAGTAGRPERGRDF